MSFFEFPHTRTYDTDLGWIIKHLGELLQDTAALQKWAGEHKEQYKELADKVDGLINNLVDVIVPWDSSAAYRIFSIVEYQGTNYIAVQDVPVGTMITNTDYWQPSNTVIEQVNAMALVVSDIRETAPRMYETVAEMQEDPELKAGDYAETAGYYTRNDGGGAKYKISVEEPAEYYETLSNNLYAQIIIDEFPVNVLKYGVKIDGTDTTEELQQAIDAYPAGQTFFLPTGIYTVDKIVLRLKTKLIGAGWGLTIIKQKLGATGNCLEVPSTSQGCLISKLTITGEDNTNTPGSGIYVAPVPVTVTSQRPQMTTLDVTNATAQEASYKYLIIDEVFILYFKNGIFLDRCRYAVYANNFQVFGCTDYGFYDNGSSDNFFRQFYLERCGKAGLYTVGSNNKWDTGKVIWNNQTDHSADNLDYENAEDETAAIYIKGSRNQFVNIEAQDNCGHGWLIWGAGNVLVNCLSDSNGYKRVDGQGVMQGGVQFLIWYGGQIRILNGIADNYAYGATIDGVDRTRACRIAYYRRHRTAVDNVNSLIDITEAHCIYPSSSRFLNTPMQVNGFSLSANDSRTINLKADRTNYLLIISHPFVGTAAYIITAFKSGTGSFTVLPIGSTSGAHFTVTEDTGNLTIANNNATEVWVCIYRLGSYVKSYNEIFMDPEP